MGIFPFKHRLGFWVTGALVGFTVNILLYNSVLASISLPSSLARNIKGEYSDKPNKKVRIEWEIDKARVLQALKTTQFDEIKIQVATQKPDDAEGLINRVEIKSGFRDCGRFTQECLKSVLLNQSYGQDYFSADSKITLRQQPVDSAKFGVFTPDLQHFVLIDAITSYTSGLKYKITLFYGEEGALEVAKVEPFTVSVRKVDEIKPGPQKDTKAYYDQFFNQSCSTAVSGKCSTFRDLLMQENRCRNLDTGKNEDGAGFWFYIPLATKQAANLAVDRRPGVCLRLSKVVKYRGAIFNGATDTWNALYFSAQNTPSEITNLFTNGIFTARLDDFGPDCPQAIRILERGCPTFALNVSSFNGSEPSSLFENNAVKAYVTVNQDTYFDMINKLYKPDGSGSYSKDHKPHSDNLDDEALKKYQINTAFSGDNPGGSGGGGETDCTNAFKIGLIGKYLIGGAICGTMEFLATIAVSFANFALNIMIYASGLQ